MPCSKHGQHHIQPTPRVKKHHFLVLPDSPVPGHSGHLRVSGREIKVNTYPTSLSLSAALIIQFAEADLCSEFVCKRAAIRHHYRSWFLLSKYATRGGSFLSCRPVLEPRPPCHLQHLLWHLAPRSEWASLATTSFRATLSHINAPATFSGHLLANKSLEPTRQDLDQLDCRFRSRYDRLMDARVLLGSSRGCGVCFSYCRNRIAGRIRLLGNSRPVTMSFKTILDWSWYFTPYGRRLECL